VIALAWLLAEALLGDDWPGGVLRLWRDGLVFIAKDVGLVEEPGGGGPDPSPSRTPR
jgi:hypothetical protein